MKEEVCLGIFNSTIRCYKFSLKSLNAFCNQPFDIYIWESYTFFCIETNIFKDKKILYRCVVNLTKRRIFWGKATDISKFF